MKYFKKISSFILIVTMILSVSSVSNAMEIEYTSIEKESGIIRNPAMGWVIYCDAFQQMTNDNMPDYNKGVIYPDLFWQTLDECGATGKAGIFYLRAPWSFYEPEEGVYAWEDPESNYTKLLNGAKERGLSLAFRVYIDSQDSFQQATPEYVKEAGAKGYTNTYWTPYANDKIFLSKFKTFIAAFGDEYNDSGEVEFIDAMGIGHWGEGHAVMFDIFQKGPTLSYVLGEISTAYRKAFPDVLLGGQQGSVLSRYSEAYVLENKYDMIRRDSLGMPKYFKEKDRDYYEDMLVNKSVPLFAENGWNYFAHDFEAYMSGNGNPFSDMRSLLEASLADAIASRANTFDLRVPEDAIIWMENEDLVDEFIINGGYRFVPTNISYDAELVSDESMQIKSQWKNTGIGRLPNNRPAWNYKYKLAYALLDSETEDVVKVCVTNVEPSDWIKGNVYNYNTSVDFSGCADGKYKLAFAIVDTSKDNKPAIELAIEDKKTADGWYKIGDIEIQGSVFIDYPSYRFNEDFSNVQGENSWYYLENRRSEHLIMNWNMKENLWQGTSAWSTIDSFGTIHPSINDVEIGWEAPKSGKIKVYGNPRILKSGGDGIKVSISKNSEKVWPKDRESLYVSGDDLRGVYHEFDLDVEKGDMIYFRLNKNISSLFDDCLWQPYIEYIE